MTRELILASSTYLGAETFRERVEVAAAAGFRAIGLSLAEFRRLTASETTAADMRSVLADNGVALRETEALFGFSVDPSMKGVEVGAGFSYATDHDIDDFFRFGEYFEASHLQVVPTFGIDEPEADAVDRFAGLCDQAADVGMNIALEFVPTSNVPDAAVATTIVVAADRPNGGICVDSWHHTRGADDLALLRAIPRNRITIIQFNDGAAQPQADFFTETMHLRQVPGEGSFDLPGFFDALSGAADPWFSVEIMSDALGAEEPGRAAQRVFSASTPIIEKCYRAADPKGQPGKAEVAP
jgi:sugar phosphate isomerase/epimerase